MSEKYISKNSKKSRKNKVDLIIYSKKNKLSNLQVMSMKNGYEYMAKLNLEYSHLGSEYLLEDIDEYEAWICGV